MKIICVDNDPAVLDELRHALERLPGVASVAAFDTAEAALDFARQNEADCFFLEADLPPMGGIELAKALRLLHPECPIVFVTAGETYAMEALKLRAAGYLMKPASGESLRQELELIMRRAVPREKPEKRIRVQCFGHFEAFCDGVPLHFERSKTKELFAYLVDRRCAVNTNELCGVLWEDRDDTTSMRTQVRILFSDLIRTLKAVNQEELIRKSRNSFAIDTDMLDCDYYGFLRQEPAAVNYYRGEYMSQYSWAELTNSGLDNS